MTVVFFIVYAIQVFILSYLFIYNTLSLFLFFIAAHKIRRYVREGSLSHLTLLCRHPGLPGVSFLMPAYNEENAIIESIGSLMNLHYPRFEIIIIND